MRTLINFSLQFFLFLAITISSVDLNAQLVVGGTNKAQQALTPIKVSPYINIDYSTWSEDEQKLRAAGRTSRDSYLGQEFTYYNIFTYNEQTAPYPWQNGRVRNGKYKASTTALNNYLEELRNRSGEKITLVKFVNEYGAPLFVRENGDTILYTSCSNAELLRTEYVDQAKKMIGKTVYYTPQNALTPERGFISTSTRESVNPMPYYSQWTIKDICVDTTYFGNNLENDFPRLAFILESQRYGEYEFFVSGLYENFSGWSKESKEINYIKDSNDINKVGDFYYGRIKHNEAMIKDACNKGYEDALFTDLYYGEYDRSDYKLNKPGGVIKEYNIDYRTDNSVNGIVNLVRKGFLPAIYAVSDYMFLPRYRMGADGKRNKSDEIKDCYYEYGVIDAAIELYDNGVREPILGDLAYLCFMQSDTLKSIRFVDKEPNKDVVQKVLKIERIVHDCGSEKDLSIYKYIIDRAKELSK